MHLAKRASSAANKAWPSAVTLKQYATEVPILGPSGLSALSVVSCMRLTKRASSAANRARPRDVALNQ